MATALERGAKVCPRCNTDKPLHEYPRDKSKAAGVATFCLVCSNTKSKLYYAANRERVRARALKARTCKTCGIPVSKRKWFCEPCRAAVRKTHEHVRDKARGNHKSHIRRAGGCGDNIPRDELGERDNWTCHLCGGAIDPTTRWPNQASASIDHLIPISKGGRHTWKNVKIAHVSCNSSRGNRDLTSMGKGHPLGRNLQNSTSVLSPTFLPPTVLGSL